MGEQTNGQHRHVAAAGQGALSPAQPQLPRMPWHASALACHGRHACMHAHPCGVHACKPAAAALCCCFAATARRRLARQEPPRPARPAQGQEHRGGGGGGSDWAHRLLLCGCRQARPSSSFSSSSGLAERESTRWGPTEQQQQAQSRPVSGRGRSSSSSTLQALQPRHAMILHANAWPVHAAPAPPPLRLARGCAPQAPHGAMLRGCGRRWASMNGQIKQHVPPPNTHTQTPTPTTTSPTATTATRLLALLLQDAAFACACTSRATVVVLQLRGWGGDRARRGQGQGGHAQRVVGSRSRPGGAAHRRTAGPLPCPSNGALPGRKAVWKPPPPYAARATPQPCPAGGGGG